ncbi:MAG: MarR family transcriptional regulator [Burkholderiales bacterium]|nr:MarR family transcriptional regulator [Burkholderiales bacterium]
MSAAPLETPDYARLAALRYTLRRFLHFSESAAEAAGTTAQHYQALLVLRAGAGAGAERLAINDLARQLLIKHNSAVGLVDRLMGQGLVVRRRSAEDRREVHLRLTAKGRRLLERVAGVHRRELERIGPDLRRLLRSVPHATRARRGYG